MALHTPVHTRPTARHRRTATRQPLRRWAASLASGMLLFAGIGIASPPSVDAANGSISGTVYRDLDNDGVRDRREPGVPGIVISTSRASAMTDANGRWTLRSWGRVDLQVSTGWYRSQCNSTDCAPGPGRDQDFSVTDQTIVAERVNGTAGATLHLGLLPDWRGGYPIPKLPISVNSNDVSARIGWMPPEGDDCTEEAEGDGHSCLVTASPRFLVQIMNEGTGRQVDPKGYIQLPGSSWIASLTAIVTPAVTSAMRAAQGTVSIGSMDKSTRRVPFTIHRTLAPGAQANLSLTLAIRSDAWTSGSPGGGGYSSIVGLRMTSVPNDPDSAWCGPVDTSCVWGRADTQRSPDNSDTERFTIVAPETAPSTSTTSTTTTTLPPTTTSTTTTTLPPTTTLSTTTTSTTTTTTVPPTTTSTTTTSTVPTTTCSVSSLLVPSCGAWLGSSTPAKDGAWDLVRGLNEYEAVARNTPDIIHLYKTGGGAFPTKSDIALVERPDKARSLLLINWKPNTSLSWRQVADGGADANIASVAAGLKAYPHKLFLTVQHEPENDLQEAGSGRTPTDYVAMYRYVVTRLRSLGVTNVVYVWNMMGSTNHAALYPTLYPGHDVVDWIAYDPYGQEKQTTIGELVNRPGQDWPGFYTWATNTAPGKPIMLAEWGFNLAVSSYGPAALDNAVPILESQFPMLKAFVYWNQNFAFKARLDQPGELGTAYGEAYGRFANQPYFNRTATALAP